MSVQSYLRHATHFFLYVWHLSTLTSAHHQQFHTTIFSFVIMSSFLLKEKTCAESFAFLFQFEEIGCRIASNACGVNALLETTCRDWFRWFNDDNFDLSDKKRENRPRKVEDCQLQALLDEDDTQSQKMLAELGVSQAAISMRLHAAWGRFKRSENECRMNWTIDRWSDAKTHAKFCLPDKKESRSCIGL